MWLLCWSWTLSTSDGFRCGSCRFPGTKRGLRSNRASIIHRCLKTERYCWQSLAVCSSSVSRYVKMAVLSVIRQWKGATHARIQTNKNYLTVAAPKSRHLFLIVTCIRTTQPVSNASRPIWLVMENVWRTRLGVPTILQLAYVNSVDLARRWSRGPAEASSTAINIYRRETTHFPVWIAQ